MEWLKLALVVSTDIYVRFKKGILIETKFDRSILFYELIYKISSTTYILRTKIKQCYY